MNRVAVRAAIADAGEELVDALATSRRHGIVLDGAAFVGFLTAHLYIAPKLPIMLAWLVGSATAILSVGAGMIVIADAVAVARRCRLSRKADR